jgi:hypothetical protein
MTMKMRGIWALFIALILILAINPKLLYNAYNTILGRIILIGVLIFFSINNVTLGLLVALCLIIVLNNYTNFAEGMDNMETPATIGDDNAVQKSGDKIQVVTSSISSAPKDGSKLSDLKANAQAKASNIDTSTIQAKAANAQANAQDKAAAKGIDTTDISESIKAKASNSIPVSKSTMSSSENVSPFTTGMLGKNTSTEGFSTYAAPF